MTADSLNAALERLRVGAMLSVEPGSVGGYIVLYEDHCKALIALLCDTPKSFESLPAAEKEGFEPSFDTNPHGRAESSELSNRISEEDE